MTNTVVYEINNLTDILQGNFAKGPNFQTSYLSFYCEFKLISNTGLKSEICSERLQNLINLSNENWCRMKL